MLSKNLFISIFACLSILLLTQPAFTRQNSIPPQNSTLPVSLFEGGSAEVSVSNGTDLKIIDLCCRKNTEECVLTWKTNITPPAKAKIVLWSGNQPSILDPYFPVNDTTGVFLHKFSLKASELPQKFVKIRLSYIISEDAGAYSDIMYEDIKLEN
jgi:hypothetical protein